MSGSGQTAAVTLGHRRATRLSPVNFGGRFQRFGRGKSGAESRTGLIGAQNN